MNSKEIRDTFFKFFESKQHEIVPSAPIVVKDDPTLMFTNAGMNQFKDYFLGNKKAEVQRVADTQKCLRVSGKHNDLEEVGVDTYHHTMFEMLGNWSFGNYFKKEAIDWAWELLTEVYKIDKDIIYVSVFEGDEKDGVPCDDEAIEFWKQHITEDRILKFDKKDNFWEMGEVGPCGPCSEIHVDLRSKEEREKVDGKTLVNADHEQVIEIWNLVFMQFQRVWKTNGLQKHYAFKESSNDSIEIEKNRIENTELIPLSAKHIDTGMGFERLVRCLQGKASNYDTDIFMPLIRQLEKVSKKQYGKDEKTDIAFRVIADHVRAVSFTIGDGQLPSNNGAGYVIRRILRRAVRYGYTFLDLNEPFLTQMLPVLVEQYKELFPDYAKQKEFISKVIEEEEKSFFKTLAVGLDKINISISHNVVIKHGDKEMLMPCRRTKRSTISLSKFYRNEFKIERNKEYDYSIDEFDNLIYLNILPNGSQVQFVGFSKTALEREHICYLPDNIYQKCKRGFNAEIDGKTAFELFDTYGFPLDLTQLIASEKGVKVDVEGFNKAMQEQKERSRNAENSEQSDWVIIHEDDKEEFVGYDYLETNVKITRYREVVKKDKKQYHLLFNYTPFYAESGGQVGDTGYIEANDEKVSIVDTQKENQLIIHIANALPQNPETQFKAVVSKTKRFDTMKNHTATHLLHEALRNVLGSHVEQRGSLVNEKHLRFDFSHFQKMTEEEIAEVEKQVNQKIQGNIALDEKRNTPIGKAKEMGAMALFGEKYGDVVRVIKFDSSVELCGGTHVQATGEIGVFKITSEASIASGIRRIEAITANGALAYFNKQGKELNQVVEVVKNPKVLPAILKLIDENTQLKKQLESFQLMQQKMVKQGLKNAIEEINGIAFIGKKIDASSADMLKNLSFELKREIDNLFLVLGAEINGKPQLSIMVSDNLVKEKNLNAGLIIRDIAKEIQGGGGGQPFFATAGGKDVSGLEKAVEKARGYVQ